MENSILKSELGRINELLTDEVCAGDEKISERAVWSAHNFIETAISALGNNYRPAKFITSGYDGGIRISYDNGGREVRLLISPVSISIYWQNEFDSYDIITEATCDLFISKLKWLSETI